MVNYYLYLKIILIYFLAYNSCGDENENRAINDVSPVSDVLDTVNYNEDIEEVDELFIIEGKAVIFFFLSKKELRKLNKELGSSYRWETDYLFNNFTKQSINFKKVLKNHNIQSDLIRNKRFLIKLKNGQTVSFNRIREDQIMGEIISDGIQDPIIEFGMFPNKELIAIINNYFQIENLESLDEEIPPIQLLEEVKMRNDSVSQIIE